MKFVLTLLLSSLSTIIVLSQSKDETDIRQVLAKQVDAWNKGTINDFMKGYWQNDSLMFIGKNGVTYSWKKTLENYNKSYPDTTVMGKLTFDILHLTPLSSDYYFVVGKWFLKRTIGNIEGHFTLLFRKINNEWVIVADHSS